MTAHPTTNDVNAIHAAAQGIAEARREPMSSAHLLAAIASQHSPAADLLLQRNLDSDTLVRLGVGCAERGHDDVNSALRRSIAVARSIGSTEPKAVHLLLALLKDPQSAAYRVLRQSGIDMARLQAAVTGVANGFASPRRIVNVHPQKARAQQAEKTSRGLGGPSRVLGRGSPPAPPYTTPKHPSARPWHAASVKNLAKTPAKTSGRILTSPGVVVPLYPPAHLTSSAPPSRLQSACAVSALPQSPVGAAMASRAAHVATSSQTGTDAVHAWSSPPSNPLSNPSPLEERTAAASVVTQGSHTHQVQPRAHASTPSKSPAKPLTAYQLDAKAFPTLNAVAVNLTLACAKGQLDAVVARETQLEQTLDVLAKRRANCALLIGPSGVGKTSTARGLAYHLLNEQPVADPRLVLELPTAALANTSATSAGGDMLSLVCKEAVAARGQLILVVDDAFSLLSSDAFEHCAEFKAALLSGKIPLVATCHAEEYRRLLDSHPALAKCFTVVEIDEPTESQAADMLMQTRNYLQSHHHVRIDEAAVQSSVSWSLRYLPGRALPDKAVHILDLAGARGQRRGLATIDEAMVAEIVAEMADMPVQRLLQTDHERLLALDTLLADQVVGHEAELARIATILRRNAVGLRSQRPIGSFLLLGPTGVGKTETAKAIADALFHRSTAMTRLDLSEFAESHALARLIGAPPGYVGHESGGQLTEAVRKRPYQVILLDEFEKSHRDVQQAFLQVFDEGRMTDGRGRTVDFTNTVIVMTSNLGAAQAQEASKSRAIGFGNKPQDSSNQVKDAVMTVARAAIPPELYNRIDEVLFFSPLTRDHVRQVATKLLQNLSTRLTQAQQVSLQWTERGVDALLDAGGYEPSLGARPMKRAIARWVEAPIAEMILRKQASAGSVIEVDWEEQEDNRHVRLRVLKAN